MKKKKLTPEQKKLNRIRGASHRKGFWRGFEHAEEEVTALYESRLAEADAIKRRGAVWSEDALARQRSEYRAAGYEAGIMVGRAQATLEVREHYERERRAMLAGSAIPEFSAWEFICASVNHKGES
jgi:hypothetical protein